MQLFFCIEHRRGTISTWKGFSSKLDFANAEFMGRLCDVVLEWYFIAKLY